MECDNCGLPIEKEKAVIDTINYMFFCSNTCQAEWEKDMGVDTDL